MGSWIGSAFPLGCLSSNFLAAYLMNTIGRRKTLILMAGPFVVGWLLLYLPVTIGMSPEAAKFMFIGGRFLTGIETSKLRKNLRTKPSINYRFCWIVVSSGCHCVRD